MRSCSSISLVVQYPAYGATGFGFRSNVFQFFLLGYSLFMKLGNILPTAVRATLFLLYVILPAFRERIALPLVAIITILLLFNLIVQIGRASCRERVYIAVVDASLNKKAPCLS